MSNQKIDSAVITGYISLVGVIIFIYCFGSYVHWQLSSSLDCSLLTEPSIDEDKNSNIGLRFPGQILTIQQTRDLCFDSTMIHKGELCYYITCGNDVNQTVNYDGQGIKQSLAKPTQLHLYPKQGEKFTIFDIGFYDVMIGILLIIPISIVALAILMFRDPKPDYRPHGTLPKGFDNTSQKEST